MKIWAVIVAAGRGERAGFDINKVYMPFGGMSALERCLKVFDESGVFAGATVVISENDGALYEAIRKPDLVKAMALGGAVRQESVYNGLITVPEDVDIVAVHDAARPFVTKPIIEATINAAAEFGSGIISTPVTDTVKQISADGSVVTLDRKTLFAVQTPQTFKREKLLYAHEKARQEGYVSTDDAALYEKYCGSIRLVTADGAAENRKLTLRSDFTGGGEMRVGHGYDAHRMKEGRKLVLCGVEIPYQAGLDGHSDADVAVHALMDAMLGAAALGDIGRHFPDNDDRYLGISSMKLLDETVMKLAHAGYETVNVDITIIAQRPKLAAYMDEMKACVAEHLGLSPDRVNVKATTTEKMGFEGRCEGISAHASVLIRELGI